LSQGENVFVWTLSDDGCIGYSSDSLVVVADDNPEAIDDVFTGAFGETFYGFDISQNDFINTEDYTLTFDTTDLQGTLTWDVNQGYSLEPSVDLVGETSVSYTYCHNVCPDKCVTGTATFRIDASDACIVPSIITPNGDGLNDSFIVPCVDAYPESYFCVGADLPRKGYLLIQH